MRQLQLSLENASPSPAGKTGSLRTFTNSTARSLKAPPVFWFCSRAACAAAATGNARDGRRQTRRSRAGPVRPYRRRSCCPRSLARKDAPSGSATAASHDGARARARKCKCKARADERALQLRACALNRLPAREVACRLGGSIVDIASPVNMCTCAGAGAQHRPACRLRLSQAGTGTCLRYDLTCPQRHRDLPTLRLDLPTAAPGLAYVTT